MRRPKYDPLVRKAVSACVAAIETYNKPVSPHREETFAILVICAWEALLKARVAKEHSFQAIFATEFAPLKDGKPGKRKRIKVNRSGNPMTLGIDACMALCERLPSKPLDPACRRNIESLIEVRDNAVHFHNEDRELARLVHEAGAAALSNFCHALEDWFGVPPGTHRFAILPLSFEPLTAATALVPASRPKQVANLMKFLDEAADAHPFEDGKRYACALRIETQIVGGRNKEAIAVRPTADPNAPVVRLSEEDIQKRFPLSFEGLVKRVKAKVPKLVQNARFHEVVREVKADPRLAYPRKHNPLTKKSGITYLYADAAVEAIERKLAKTLAAP